MLIKFITELPLGNIVRLIRSEVITLNRGLFTNCDVISFRAYKKFPQMSKSPANRKQREDHDHSNFFIIYSQTNPIFLKILVLKWEFPVAWNTCKHNRGMCLQLATSKYLFPARKISLNSHKYWFTKKFKNHQQCISKIKLQQKLSTGKQ